MVTKINNIKQTQRPQLNTNKSKDWIATRQV